jgi:Mannosyltransferase (PIG-V)
MEPARKILNYLRASDAFRATLFAFVLTRILVIGLLVIGGTIHKDLWGRSDDVHEVMVPISDLQVARTLKNFCTGSDPGWYNGIARNGYEKLPFSINDHHNWAFLPLFPLTWRMAATVTREFEMTGIVLTHIFFFLALLMVHKTVTAFGFSPSIAERTIVYVAIFPASFFFSLPMTESLFLLLTASSIYNARKERWWTAAALALLAAITRLPGILLMPTLALLYWQNYGFAWRRKEWLSLLIIPSGLIVLMVYMHAITGDALAFIHIHSVWGRRLGFFLVPLFQYLRNPTIAVPWDLQSMNFAAAVGALVCGVILLKWRHWALGFYTLGSMIVTLSSLSLTSHTRFAMVLFPMQLVLAVAGEKNRINVALCTIFSGLLCLMTALYAANFMWLR